MSTTTRPHTLTMFTPILSVPARDTRNAFIELEKMPGDHQFEMQRDRVLSTLRAAGLTPSGRVERSGVFCIYWTFYGPESDAVESMIERMAGVQSCSVEPA